MNRLKVVTSRLRTASTQQEWFWPSAPVWGFLVASVLLVASRTVPCEEAQANDQVCIYVKQFWLRNSLGMPKD